MQGGLTIGVDLRDRCSCYCVLNEQGEIVLEEKMATMEKAMRERFAKVPRCRMAPETGTHSRGLSECEVIVVHAQEVQLITKSQPKDDSRRGGGSHADHNRSSAFRPPSGPSLFWQ